MKRIRLVIVDHSAFVRKAIQRALESDPRIEVVGTPGSGEELVQNLDCWNPDVIILDLKMPGMGGLQTLDSVMAWKPVPVIILSTQSSHDAPVTIEALYRGAVDFIDMQQFSLVDFGALRAVLLGKILQVVSASKPSTDALQTGLPIEKAEAPAIAFPQVEEHRFDALLIGASAGGPPAIQKVLEDLVGYDLPVPVAIVQHMPVGFTKALVDRLGQYLPFPVKEAVNGESFFPGTVYFAPSGQHLRIEQKESNIHLALSSQPENVPHRPSIDVLFQSAVPVFGKKVVAVLLTGMGMDGAQGMFELSKAGAYTIAQNEASCAVYGMPRAAVELGAAGESLHLNQIGRRLKNLLIAKF